MGKFFIDESDKVRVSFPDGEWAEIKSEMSQEDSDYVMNKMAEATSKGDTPDIRFNLGKMALLERNVIAWSFGVAVNKETISKLKNKYRKIILEAIDTANTEAKDFPLSQGA